MTIAKENRISKVKGAKVNSLCCKSLETLTSARVGSLARD